MGMNGTFWLLVNEGGIRVKVVRENDPLGRDVELIRRHWFSSGQPKPATKGSVGAEMVDGLTIKDEDYKLVKTRFSAFFNTHLHSYLHGLGINSLVLTGVQTPNCIRLFTMIFLFNTIFFNFQHSTSCSFSFT
ncbi:hypothetical protein LIER_40331 [Lithospermum erythrorhizon]|uniref:Isochorismatase-like domain-containing protein n=1 Tax=Lithospermum erythrorhizon TaxID=34254 RepID=A0AAV3QU35_LITER